MDYLIAFAFCSCIEKLIDKETHQDKEYHLTELKKKKKTVLY